MKRRVVVTGMGVLSPLGHSTGETWNALVEGRSGIGPITHFDPEAYPTRIAGEVKDFDVSKFLDKKAARKMDRFSHFAIAATKEALEDASLTIDESNAERIGVYLGSGIGGLPLLEEQHKVLMARGPRRMSPFFIPGMIVNLAAGQVSIFFGAKGPNLAVATACATGSHAIGESFRLIREGYADGMICGGTEAVITEMSVGGFCAMKAMSTRNDEPERASRPFDSERDGFVMGEGAGVLILEEREYAISRGARILAEVLGYGMSGDAYHISAPSADGDGPIRAMRIALNDANLSPDSIDYINAHGTSTPAGDKAETLAVKKVFGDHAQKLAFASTKSMTGHLLGAAGGLETAVSVLAVHHDVIPPTINYENPDPECDLDCVPNEARRTEVNVALNNSFGFGGTNATLILGKHR
ncbi:3-oxoacyl-ACP synthase [Acidobacteria bacterium Mor1]|nr:3-oxoacyl-ACP synthase [Acidobacteria bacterium Mor1]